jgi:hypothetical protein
MTSNNDEFVTCTKASKKIQLPSHVVVPLEGLRKVVDENLTNCKECNIGELELVHHATLGVASKLKINCKNCHNIRNNLVRKRSRIHNIIVHKSRYTVQQRNNIMHLRSKVQYINKQIKKIDDIDETRSITPQHVIEKDKKNNNKEQFINSALNLRCMLSAYHLGTGGLDIMKHLSMMGCDTNHAIIRNFTRNSGKVNELIIKVCNSIVDEQMMREIQATIKTKHSKQEANDTTLQDIKSCDNSIKLEDLELKNKVELTCSYDMGWSKRAGGRIYDSASGHGYLVGVKLGKIVAWGVKKKKVVSAM